MFPEVNLSVEISGLRFKNPVLTASGTFGYGSEFADFFDISELGGFCTKGLRIVAEFLFSQLFPFLVFHNFFDGLDVKIYDLI